jgi:hypothetical protein
VYLFDARGFETTCVLRNGRSADVQRAQCRAGGGRVAPRHHPLRSLTPHQGDALGRSGPGRSKDQADPGPGVHELRAYMSVCVPQRRRSASA